MRAWWSGLFAVSACYRGAADESCRIRCTDNCPSGLSCVAGYCTSGAVCAGDVDASVDSVAVDAPVDAAVQYFVQHADIGMAGAATVSFPYALEQRAGDLNVVVIAYAVGISIVSVTDTSGNAYAVAAPALDSNAGAQAMYYARNIAAAGAGANTVTVTFSAATNVVLRGVEYTGISATSLVEAEAHGDGTAVDSGPLVVPFAPALLVGADQLVYNSVANDPAYTLRSDYFGNTIEDRLVSMTGSYQATDVQNISAGWVMQLIAFQP